MLLLLRKLKHDHFMKKKARKYLLYAVGEIVLIIIGILIALQIDNWNTDRQERKALQSHLRGVATNIRSDLEQAERTLEYRIRTHEAAVNANTFLRARPSFSVSDIFTAAYALQRVAMPMRFDVTTSNYESLKASGVLKLLQGHDIEPLLFEYYESASRIESMEQEYRAVLATLLRQLTTDWPEDIDPFEFYDPSVLSQARFDQFEPLYRSFIQRRSTVAIFQAVVNQYQLMLEYATLIQRGNVLLDLIDSDAAGLAEEQVRILDGIHDPQSGLGYPAIIAEGQVAWHSYWLGIADSYWFADRTSRAFGDASFRVTPDGIRVAYVGGADWAALWLAPAGIAERRPSLDFSGFDRLQLELRGDQGGETVLVNLKDKDDPDDGSQTNIALQLTTEWKTFDIDLASFENADPAALHVALGFVFIGAEPQTFWIRNAHYVANN